MLRPADRRFADIVGRSLLQMHGDIPELGEAPAQDPAAHYSYRESSCSVGGARAEYSIDILCG